MRGVTTPQQLADRLDVDEKYVRHVLREEYPDDAPGKGRRWDLTPEMCDKVQVRVVDTQLRRLGRSRR